MNAHAFCSELETLLVGFTSPRGMTERALDDRCDRGTEAGNRLGREIRRVTNDAPDMQSYPGSLFVRLKDGSAVTITITHAPARG